MARRRRRRVKKSALDYISIPRLDLDPDTKKSIFILFMLALGAISLLGLFGLAGSFGIWVAKILKLGFGWGKWLFPIIVLGLVYVLYKEDKYYISITNYIGLFLFVVSFQSILHFLLSQNSWEYVAEAGEGGGYIGMYLAMMFNSILGFWGGLIVLIILFIGSLVLLFDSSLSRIIGSESVFARVLAPINNFVDRLLGRGEYEDEEDEEEDDEIEEEIDEDEEDEEEDDEIEEEIDEETGFSRKRVEAEPEFMQEELGVKDKKAPARAGWKSSPVKIELPLDLLNGKSGKPGGGDLKNNSLIIQRTLENFGIPVEMGDVSVGPTVTQYTFKPAEGIKLSRITTLSNDLALALAAHPIRIEAPIPGKALVGVEVPNQTKAIVGLKEILEDDDFVKRKNSLSLALGKDVSGKCWMYDLSKMPHLLVAGATNSGKSVCLNSIIVSLLYQNNPEDLRFIMVDPKRVELPVYNGIPHLMTPVITDVGKTINALKWCLNEMDRRFELLSKHGKRNIQSYNEKAKDPRKGGAGKMPYIVFIIDELADLMVAAARDIEGSVIRLAQMARAVGIHLILATQRPSVDVITGLIKANMPARIAFSVASGVDSKTILDSLGAEKLLGQGDMLFITAEISKPKRIQGAYVSDNEIKKITNYIKEKAGEVEYVEGITDRQKVQGVAGVGLDGETGDEDELLAEAKEIVINMNKASASLLQRRLSIGYARAARIIDMLEEIGVVGPSNGAKPREILITKEQYVAMSETGVSGVSIHNRDEEEARESYLGEDESETVTVFKQDELEEDDETDEDEEAEDGEDYEDDESGFDDEEGSENEESETEEEIEEEESSFDSEEASEDMDEIEDAEEELEEIEEDEDEESDDYAEDEEDKDKIDQIRKNREAQDDLDEDEGMFFSK